MKLIPSRWNGRRREYLHAFGRTLAWVRADS
jgi:hypothetical protein